MDVGFWSGLGRGIFGFLDRIIYGFIKIMYGFFFQLSEVSILKQATIEQFASRIYIIIGIVMLFKVTFSLIQYFANPDSITGDKGIGKLIQKTILMLILLVSVPIIFDTAFRIQKIILNENILGNLILGSSTKTEDEIENIYSVAGDRVAVGVLKGFFHPYEDVDCSAASSGDVRDWCNMQSIDEFTEGMITRESNGKYIYDYSIFISTLAGGLVAWIIGIFCFDVAIRSVKLSFLQLLAPVPIVSSIDPKGQKIMDSWVKESISTYLSLFVRLIAIYFVVFVIGELTEGSGLLQFYKIGSDEVADIGFFGQAMIIIGLLLFAKQVPKLIESIFGIKLDTKFTLNPMKRLGEVPMVGKASAVAGGVLAGTVAGSRVGAPLRGAALGALTGARSVPFMGDKDGKSFSKGANTTYKALMGKDFLTFGPEKVFTAGGTEKVDEIKSALKQAYSIKDQLGSALNVAQSTTANEVKALNQQFGLVDPTNQDEIDRIKGQLTGDQLTAFNTHLNNYNISVQNETSIRKDISSVDKDIKDLSSEKAQRERFYNVDPSPASTVSKLTKDIYSQSNLDVDQWRQNKKS